MAEKAAPQGDPDSDAEYEELVKKFGEFNAAADLVKKDKTKLTTKACGKMVKECLNGDFGKYKVGERTDASVFPAVKPKGQKDMPLNKETVKKFCYKLGHEMAKEKNKSKSSTLKENDDECQECRHKIKKLFRETKPGNSGTKASKTGGVDRLTDTKHYTGSHKERFDDTGKGKGKEGRENLHANDGYVGQYKNKDTYDKKKK